MLRLINRFCVKSRTIKVKDEAIWINVENNQGNLERVCAFEGESLFFAIRRAGSNINGEDCASIVHSNLMDRPIENSAANLMCTQCHIHIEKPWFNKMERDKEIHHLEYNSLRDKNLPKGYRYSCAIRVEKWMNEMKIRLAPNELDFYDDPFFNE